MFNCCILKHENTVIGIFKDKETAEYHRDMWLQMPGVSSLNWFCDLAYIPGLPF